MRLSPFFGHNNSQGLHNPKAPGGAVFVVLQVICQQIETSTGPIVLHHQFMPAASGTCSFAWHGPFRTFSFSTTLGLSRLPSNKCAPSQHA